MFAAQYLTPASSLLCGYGEENVAFVRHVSEEKLVQELQWSLAAA